MRYYHSIFYQERKRNYHTLENQFFNKDAPTENKWTFELGVETGNIVPMFVIVGFQRGNRLGRQNADNDVFYRPPVSRAQCNNGVGKKTRRE